MLDILDRCPMLSGKLELDLMTECLNWQGYRNPAGYGQITVNMKGWLLHRYVFTQFSGPIPDGLIVMHKCDNPACCNPDHLLLGTHGHNVRDKEAKGRGNQGSQNGQAKLTNEQVLEIRQAYTGARGELASLGRKYGVHRSCIFKIVNNQHWSKLR